MRALFFCSVLTGCIAVPEPPSDATAMDADIADAALYDAALRDAGYDARMPFDAAQRDAGRDGATITDAGSMDARVDGSGDATMDAAMPQRSIVITEMRTRGPNGANDEFVEIANATATTIDVSGFRLRAASASGSVGTRAIIPAGIVLGPGERLLFANNGSAGYSGATTPDVTYTFGLADECGVAIDDGAGVVFDSLGTLAASTLYEGTPRAPLSDNADRAHSRRMSGATLIDTNDNASDFETIMPSTPVSGAP